MIKTFCDICEKELAKDCSDQVNLDFNAFACVGFVLALNDLKYNNELNLCKDCADSVVFDIEDLKRIAEATRRANGIQN